MHSLVSRGPDCSRSGPALQGSWAAAAFRVTKVLFAFGQSFPGLLQPLSKHWETCARSERSATMQSPCLCSPHLGRSTSPPPHRGIGGLECEGDRVIVTHVLPGVVELFVSDHKHVSQAGTLHSPAHGVTCFCGRGSGRRCGNWFGSLSYHHSTLQPSELGQTAQIHGHSTSPPWGKETNFHESFLCGKQTRELLKFTAPRNAKAVGIVVHTLQRLRVS